MMRPKEKRNEYIEMKRDREASNIFTQNYPYYYGYCIYKNSLKLHFVVRESGRLPTFSLSIQRKSSRVEENKILRTHIHTYIQSLSQIPWQKNKKGKNLLATTRIYRSFLCSVPSSATTSRPAYCHSRREQRQGAKSATPTK